MTKSKARKAPVTAAAEPAPAGVDYVPELLPRGGWPAMPAAEGKDPTPPAPAIDDTPAEPAPEG